MRRARKRTTGKCSSNTRSCSELIIGPPPPPGGYPPAATPRRRIAWFAMVPAISSISAPRSTNTHRNCPAHPTSTHRAQRPQPDFRRNFRGRHDRPPRKNRLQPSLEVIARRTGTKKHGRGRGGVGADKVFQRIGEPAHQRRSGNRGGG